MPNLVEVEGFAELQRRIIALSNPKDKKREILAILRNVAMITVRAARQHAPVGKRRARTSLKTKKTYQPGTLKKSIGTITGKRGNAKENPTIYAGPRAKGSNNGWYGHFVELGHNVYQKGYKRKRKKGANNSAGVKGFVKGNPFMQKAYQQTGGSVTSEAQAKVAKFIQKRIDNLSR